MNCLCLTTRIDRPSTRYRFNQYIPYITSTGIKTEVAVVPKGLPRWRIFSGAGRYSGVFIQKKLFSKFQLRYLRNRAGYIIYDFDDAVMYSSSSRDFSTHTRRYKRFQYVAEVADLIIAGNRYLASKVGEEHSSKVVVIPTVVDVSGYPVKDYTVRTDKVTLGWIGTKSTLGYLKIIEPVVHKLAKRYPQMEFKIVSDGKLDIQADCIVHRPWQLDRELEELLSFDIGLMPLAKDPWTEGKCGFKIVQYMSAGLPVVCSPVGVNNEMVKHGVNGFIAGSLQQWEEGLARLIEDRVLRNRMGLAGRNRAEKDYNLLYWGPYMGRLLKERL